MIYIHIAIMYRMFQANIFSLSSSVLIQTCSTHGIRWIIRSRGPPACFAIISDIVLLQRKLHRRVWQKPPSNLLRHWHQKFLSSFTSGLCRTVGSSLVQITKPCSMLLSSVTQKKKYIIINDILMKII